MKVLEALRTTTESIKMWVEEKFLNKSNIDSVLSPTSENPVQNKTVNNEINNLKTMIGEVDVSEQINSALDEATADDFGIYVQAAEPTDAVDGDIWIDTANDPTAIEVDVPDALPNPNALTFSGAVSESYDGSSAVNVVIPDHSGKVNTSDIVNNLTTNESNKPLSAAQGVVLKSAMDAIKSLPSVTTNDNGKILMVVNGEWSVVDLNISIDSNGVVSI